MNVSKIKGNAPFKFDIVGSFLRPEELKQARADYECGKITAEELRELEDEAVVDLVEKQRKVGLKVITDGEFRRSWWHLDFMWGFWGVEKYVVKEGYIFNGEVTRAESTRLTGKISGENHPFVEHFKFVKSLEQPGEVARQTIPAPAQFLAELQRPDNIESVKKYYSDQQELIDDIADAYQTVIKDLYKAGCRNVQFDDCTWGMFCDTTFWEANP
ncbi:MAG: 5-methyltetrahydropteroyltriglutamate--homocysteine methyltransferase, partial [Clostridiales bacterium]|nr:5-methyltetrahydropteroyltriglutamate--homocysteine methyltransferase [Clostridiales bacterium]